MRIFDLVGSTDSQRRGHRVALLGTCRLFGPFEELVDRGRAIRIWDDGVGTNDLAAALQIVRNTRGKFDIPKIVRPLIFQPDERPVRTRMDRTILDTVDTFFVEISESWHISYPPYILNVNHFYSEFVSKYGRELLGWYRAFAAGTIDAAMIESTMAKLADRDLDLEERIWIESLVRHARWQFAGDAEVSAAMLDAIMFDPGKQWILVPLFLVPGVEGDQMSRRAEGIELARQLSGKMKLTMYDPTELLKKHGVRTALAGEGRDVHHYDAKFLHIVADGLLGAAGLVAQPDETASVAAARINETLVELHRQRLSLGVNESGLYAHYKGLLDMKAIAGPAVAKLASIVIDVLPGFEEYHVLRAGLGELAFVLSSLGLTTTAYEPNAARFEAMKAGLARLGADDPIVARCLTIHGTALPDLPVPNRILGLAHHLIGYPSEQQDQVLARLARYGALLINPIDFLFNRPSAQEQDELLAKLDALGFRNIRRVSEHFLFCSRFAAPTAPSCR